MDTHNVRFFWKFETANLYFI